MTEQEITDRPYAEAAISALGRQFGNFMQGCMEGGMTRDEAFVVTQVYVQGIAAARVSHDEEDD